MTDRTWTIQDLIAAARLLIEPIEAIFKEHKLQPGTDPVTAELGRLRWHLDRAATSEGRLRSLVNPDPDPEEPDHEA